jgi:tRNA pseudouridine13 synthase
LQEIGIEGYATSFAGIGGSIRVSAKDFEVHEVIDDNILNSIKNEYSQQRFAIFTLEKENIDSIHAARIASKLFHAKVRILGLKDSRAHTTQYLAVRAARNLQPSLTRGDITLSMLGYTDENFSLRALLGNTFKIWIRSVNSDAEQAKKHLELLKDCFEARKIPNFYGYQRFGASRPITHLVGRALVNASFGEAVRILVAEESSNDSDQVSEARRSFTDGRLKEAMQSFPEGYDIEKVLVESLIEKSNDYITALRKTSLRVRRLFLAAYSSYIFNKVLSKAIGNKESLDAEKGDIAANLLPDYRVSVPSVYNGNVNMIPMVPTLGYGYYPKNGRFDNILQGVMKEEQVTPKMFYVKEMQETSLQTGLRAAPLLGGNLTHQILSSDVFMAFFLVKGSYATVLLREVMRSET